MQIYTIESPGEYLNRQVIVYLPPHKSIILLNRTTRDGQLYINGRNNFEKWKTAFYYVADLDAIIWHTEKGGLTKNYPLSQGKTGVILVQSEDVDEILLDITW